MIMKETTENWIEAFLQYAQMKRWSINTISTYSNAIKMFKCAFPNLRLKEISDDKILNYLIAITGTSNRCTHHSAIKCLYNKVFHYPFKMRYIEYPVKEDKIPDHVTTEDFLKIISAASNIKHKAILLLTYDCGLRVSEVINMKLSDVDGANMNVKVVQGKGKKDRLLKLTKYTLELLRAYYKKYKPAFWLFQNDTTHKQYSIRSCQELFKTACNKAGVVNYKFHALRHGFAMALYEKGGYSLETIRDLLGHKSVETTQVYARKNNNVIQLTQSPLELIVSQKIFEKPLQLIA